MGPRRLAGVPRPAGGRGPGCPPPGRRRWAPSPNARPPPGAPAPLEPRARAVAAGDVLAAAHLSGSPVGPGALTAAVDCRARTAVPAGAVLVHPTATWDDLVLSDDRLSQLREAVAR